MQIYRCNKMWYRWIPAQMKLVTNMRYTETSIITWEPYSWTWESWGLATWVFGKASCWWTQLKPDAILGWWWPYLNMKTILFSQVWRAVHSRQYLSCQVYEKIIATLLINQLVGSNDFTKKWELHQKQLTFMSMPVKRASHNSKQPKNNSVNIILITHVHVLSLHPMGN